MKETVNVERLIDTFSSMAKRKTLLTRDDLQEDLFTQIIGTIVKVSMDEEKKVIYGSTTVANDENTVNSYTTH